MQKSPLELQREQESLDWMNQTKGPEFDVTKLNALTPQLSLYNHAKAGQEGERLGIGALRMGQMGDNSGLAALLASQQQAHREQDAAGQLENAFAAKDAEMRGSVMPLLNFQQGRSMGLASLASGNANNSTAAWANFRPAPSFWQKLLLQSAQNGAQAAQMMG